MTPMKLDRGILIAIEGVDGAGKTTQATKLVEALLSAGLDAVYRKEPTDSPYGREIRRSAREGRLSVEDELALFIADRRQHVADVLVPGLAAGTIFIVDRYYYSTAAYQGARGLDAHEIVDANEQFAPRPDLLVIIDVDASLGLERVHQRGTEVDLFEREDLLTKSRSIFGEFDGAHVLRIDGRRSIEQIHEAILDAVYRGPLRDRLPNAAWQQLARLEAKPRGPWGDEVAALVADSAGDPEAIIRGIRAIAERSDSELRAASPVLDTIDG